MEKFRAKNLTEFYGQKHLVGEDGVIKILLEKNTMKSSIFYGPSGTGKTTLASIISNTLEIEYGLFNAAIDKKSDLVNLIDNALYQSQFLIIIDEIHRLNKDKQDILLPYLESSSIIFIGLTTNNPYHSVNAAIRSRMHIFEFKPLNSDDIFEKLIQISDVHFCEYNIDKEVLKDITNSCNGDVRYAINQLDMLSLIANDNVIDKELFVKLNPQKSLLIDKNSDYYFDLLSAFQKSLRGSDVDAALHYLAQLINLGDLDIICRRLIIISYEDVGLANPSLHQRILSAINAAQLVGLPECIHPLSFAVIEIALSPKSNTAYTALISAINDTKTINNIDVPETIIHHTNTYKYPHDYGGWVDQQYLPDSLIKKKYVNFKNNDYEKKLKKTYDKINELKKN